MKIAALALGEGVLLEYDGPVLFGLVKPRPTPNFESVDSSVVDPIPGVVAADSMDPLP